MRALIVVDVQNDFAHPSGNLSVPDGQLVVYRVNQLLDGYDLVVYTKDCHPPITRHFDKYGGPWPTHCVGGTWGAEFHNDLEYNGGKIIYKGIRMDEDGYSGFSVEDTTTGQTDTTELDHHLTTHGVTEVDIVGIALDVCVKSTALDAADLGYYTTVIRDATAPVTEEGGEAAVEELLDNGVHVV